MIEEGIFFSGGGSGFLKRKIIFGGCSNNNNKKNCQLLVSTCQLPPMAMPELSSGLQNYKSLYPHNDVVPRLSSVPVSSLPSLSNADFRPISLNRRLLFNLSVHVSVLLCNPLAMAAGPDVLSLQRYTDSDQGFTLLKPNSWIQVDKAGATVLFEDPDKGSNNVGIVVSPVRISRLSDFGTPQFVADKLIGAEKRKESTKEAEVVCASERTGTGGLQVYEFEYKVDSTMGGMKRVFSAAFVAAKKLYLLNITHSDSIEIPLQMDRRMVLEQVLHSFDAAPV